MLNMRMAAFELLGRIGCRKIILSYDNMCHLNNLIVAKSPLPLPGDLKYIWSNITKVWQQHSNIAQLIDYYR